MKTALTRMLAAAMLLIGNHLCAQNPLLELNPKLELTTEKFIAGFDALDDERIAELKELGDFMVDQLAGREQFSALFVCTHNSRRSHLADLWFKYGMYYYDLLRFESYSGGTEATAFNRRAIEAIKRAGFTVVYDKKAENPTVSITPKTYPVWNMKSKVYTDDPNPKSDFVAVMVCSDADKSCPLVDGAVGRFALPYDDPRHFDDTPSEERKYDETVALIGTEMLFLAHYIKHKTIVQAEPEK